MHACVLHWGQDRTASHCLLLLFGRRWFNFYGFDVGEIPNFSEVIAQSGKLTPCTYMCRLLLSARAERLDKDAELLAAHSVAAAPYEDPRVIPILLFSDVYEVR